MCGGAASTRRCERPPSAQLGLLRLPVKSQSISRETWSRQYQPMISWERKWVELNATGAVKSFSDEERRFKQTSDIRKMTKWGWIVRYSSDRVQTFNLLHNITSKYDTGSLQRLFCSYFILFFSCRRQIGLPVTGKWDALKQITADVCSWTSERCVDDIFHTVARYICIQMVSKPNLPRSFADALPKSTHRLWRGHRFSFSTSKYKLLLGGTHQFGPEMFP